MAALARRAAALEDDLAELGHLAGLSSRLPDARVEVCAAGRRLLGADAVVCFEEGPADWLESVIVAGPALAPMRVDVRRSASVVARVFRDGGLVLIHDDAPGLAPLGGMGAVSLLAGAVERGTERIGVLAWAWRARRPLSRRDRAVAEALIAEKGLAAERQHLVREIREEILAEMRASRSQNLHDAVSHELAELHGYLQTLTVVMADKPHLVPGMLQLMEEHVVEAGGELGHLLTVAWDDPLLDRSLPDAMRALARDFGDHVPAAEVRLDMQPLSVEQSAAIRPSVREALYFVTQEALHNVAVHAHAAHVRVEVGTGDDSLVLAVRDDGLGFDPAAVRAGRYGIARMQERADLLGGELRIRSRVGTGTEVRLAIPRPRSSAVLKDGAVPGRLPRVLAG
jgi:signal transduction histidine kinase